MAYSLKTKISSFLLARLYLPEAHPKHPLPVAYEDSWNALQWAASHAVEETINIEEEPRVTKHEDFGKIYIGGDSSRGNIAHNILLRPGAKSLPGDVKIFGGFLYHPYL
ncbi:2-hydroxyisoflavanone dehydratase-like [Olea europaea subsp. europaea]|uniref:2-hydroxyisoflavanone dehydratase-like n=1 Tax=Olea europaea subsp. europaea TaxID=158383 RepID=A0A8S0VKY1_OLEEU|nr:2-hydroxyisoflavanone dehydratase-like [Olea europaea subsp. europaea]